MATIQLPGGGVEFLIGQIIYFTLFILQNLIFTTQEKYLFKFACGDKHLFYFLIFCLFIHVYKIGSQTRPSIDPEVNEQSRPIA